MKEFKAGDLVVLTRNHPDSNHILIAGCTGTVLKTPKLVTDWISVCWDMDVDGHDCDGLCERGHGWRTAREYLEVIEDEPIDPDGLDNFMQKLGT